MLRIENNLIKVANLMFALRLLFLSSWRLFRAISASFTFWRFASPKEKPKAFGVWASIWVSGGLQYGGVLGVGGGGGVVLEFCLYGKKDSRF